MKTYSIDPASGRACEDGSEQALRLCLMDREEFAACKDPLPHRGGLLRAMDAARLHSCRAERYAHCLLGTMEPPGDEAAAAPAFGFYLQPDALYLVGGGPALADHVNRVRQALPESCGTGDILLALFNQLLEKEADRLTALSAALDETEGRLLVRTPKDFYHVLLRFQRRLSRLHTYYQQLIDLGEVMEDALRALAGPAAGDSWQRYTARAARLHDYAETLREHLVQLRELYEAQVSAAQNKTMTLLTVVTALFAPLTLLAGWYGMNFAYMPELQSPYGYIAVIAASIAIVVAEIVWFKHKNML